MFATGYVPRRLTVEAGERAVVLERVRPVVLRLPGLRQLVGPTCKVRVSMNYTGSTDLLPKRLVDQWTGKSFSLSRDALGMSGRAWLAESDTVRIKVTRNGRYEVVLRFYGDGVNKRIFTVLAVVDVQMDGSESARLEVPVDGAQVRSALAQLRAAGK